MKNKKDIWLTRLIVLVVCFGLIFLIGTYEHQSRKNSKNAIKTTQTTTRTTEKSTPKQSTTSTPTRTTTTKATTEKATTEAKTTTAAASKEFKNALEKAKSYASRLNMSKLGIYEQLTSEYGENFEEGAAQYAIDNLT